MKNITVYAKLDLRRLWPVLSTTLYPETEKRVRNTLEDIRDVSTANGDAEDSENLVGSVEKLIRMLETHNKMIAEIIVTRLSAFPYGTQKFPAGYFEEACEKHALSSAQIKTQWTQIRNMARRCFGKTRSTAEEKLALARLNAVEQDILYVLFVEHHHLCPLILKASDI